MTFVWNSRPCLVTGGAGFAGSHLCEQLVSKGARVYVLDRILNRDSYLVLSGTLEQINFTHGDVRDLAFMKYLLERFEINTIFHLAAQPLIPMSNSLPLETLETNVTGTYNLLEAMRSSRSVENFIFASSGAYYGPTTGDTPIPEDRSPAPSTNIYGPSKVAPDIAVRSYYRTYGLNTVVCRFMNTYGPGDSNFSRLIPRAIRMLMAKSDYNFGDRDDGSTRLAFLHIRDMAQGYLKATEHIDVVAGEAINFGGDTLTETGEVAELASRLFDGEVRRSRFLASPRQKPYTKLLDISKARRLLDWKPEINLKTGLAETITWYRQHWGERILA